MLIIIVMQRGLCSRLSSDNLYLEPEVNLHIKQFVYTFKPVNMTDPAVWRIRLDKRNTILRLRVLLGDLELGRPFRYLSAGLDLTGGWGVEPPSSQRQPTQLIENFDPGGVG